ncbi:ATP-binding protein [Streptomyces rhizosphaericus]
MFTQRFSSTPLGARLARQLTLHQLHDWGIPHDTRISDTAALIVAELCANAATHGRVPGRDFELRLTLTEAVLRVEVSDTRGEKRPPSPGEVTAPPVLSETRRGLLLVDSLVDRWTVLDRAPVGKTVRAELDLRH